MFSIHTLLSALACCSSAFNHNASNSTAASRVACAAVCAAAISHKSLINSKFSVIRKFKKVAPPNSSSWCTCCIDQSRGFGYKARGVKRFG